MTDWTIDADNLWSRTIIRQGLTLVLRVFPDDEADINEPWVWEVVKLEGKCDEIELALGEAPTLSAAMAAADAAAQQAQESQRDARH
jgi:ribosomal protein L12E/L44/L45/RPP1/RPP2